MVRSAELNSYFSDVATIKNVGPKRVDLFKNLFRKDDVFIKDILFHLPVATIAKNFTSSLNFELVGKNVIVEVDVIDHQTNPRFRNSRAPKKIICRNADVELIIVYFNIPEASLKANFPVGARRVITGKLELFDGIYQMVHPQSVLPVERKSEVKELEPIYPLTAGLNNKYLQKIIEGAFAKVPKLPEWQNKEFLQKNNFKAFLESLHALHNPKAETDISFNAPARMRLAYDELLADQLAIAFSRERVKRSKGAVVKCDDRYSEKLLKVLPFELTNAQKEVLLEIKSDFSSAQKMFRLLQGDVGSGKTIVALLAMLGVVEAGFQVVLMAPTEILAQQHFNGIKKLLDASGLNINIELLTGSIKPKGKQIIQGKIESGEVNIVIGTHALFQDKVNFKNLAFVVIDEQHRFGVKQRMQLASKGEGVHTLLMSATPIPRTLSLTLYGDMDVSVISEKPQNRKLINTITIPLARMSEVIEAIERKLEQNEQVYWICPLVEPSDEEEVDEKQQVAAAVDRFKELQKHFGEKVALVHGQMKASEKDKAMLAFKNNEKQILVATTVVEVGVDVPNATVIVIENSEKFGLAQLHQLRGRVGRGDKQSSCILLYANNISDTSKQRLKIIRETEDGFRIAEEDLTLRGSGELLGTKQSGLPEYNFAVLPEHRELLFAARDDVKYIMQTDANLISERGVNLRNLLYLFEYDKFIKNLQT
jgi:ATP-dependent DNA helicase RecG